MVAGAFGRVRPCFTASPERGRTWASYPVGIASASPVRTSRRSSGRSVKSGSALATSYPAAPAVCRLGSGNPSWCGSRRTCTTGPPRRRLTRRSAGRGAAPLAPHEHRDHRHGNADPPPGDIARPPAPLAGREPVALALERGERLGQERLAPRLLIGRPAQEQLHRLAP